MTRRRRTLEPIVDLATHPRRYVTVRALAAYLDCDARTILRMIYPRALPATRVGRRWRIPVDEARLAFGLLPQNRQERRS